VVNHFIKTTQMTLNYYLSISIVILMACQSHNKVIELNSNIQQRTFHQVYDQSQDLNGVWKLVGTDSQQMKYNMETENAEDNFWNFIADEHILYTSQPISRNIQPSTDNNYQYWSEGCLLQINHRTYLYSIHSIIDHTGTEVGKDLTIYENTDPGIADDGLVYRFRNIDSFWACGTTDNASNEEPQLVSLIDGIVLRGDTPIPNLKGKWRLTQFSAFAPPSKIPDYRNHEIIWDFGTNKTVNKLTISKSNLNIENDYSYIEGKHSFWMNQCVLKIGLETYRFDIHHNNDTENLILTAGLSPGIADHSRYIFERI